VETDHEETDMPPDLEPAARRLAALVESVDPARLDGPTPCPEYTLGDLLDHVSGLARAFDAVARKDLDDPATQGAPGDATRLGDDWQTRIPKELMTMAAAWRAPDAWTGQTRAGSIDLPGEVAGLVALDELVIHGWDVARASGRDFEIDEASLTAIQPFLAPFADAPDGTPGLFGPAVRVPDAAPLLDRTLALTGRDPAWSPARA
jgi:uncharacterized protein (TIGR03086 family)